MTESDLPRSRAASVDVLLRGSLTEPDGGVASTCSLVRDGDRVMIVDPGMATGPEAILEPLRSHGLGPEDVTDVVVSHHHPDHTIYMGLFTRAGIHDFWATYRGTDWEDADADRRELSPSVRLLRVPGHTREDIATVVGTARAIVVLTHAWFTATGPAVDPTAEDPAALTASRARILAIADEIVPGHGPAFTPDASTPR
jgi:glyoxylase-like metal-dependent hydrolase (beta-lactamase superfamily II)